jgi:hypothetical protein
MKPFEMYKHLTEDTNPSDPIVAEEIKRGLREPSGVTDVHDHMSRFFQEASGDIVEIGVRYGCSTSAFLAGWSNHVWSIDIKDCSSLFSNPRWTFIQGDSVHDVGRIMSQIPREFHLLFVDGDHTFEGVYSDLLHFGGMAEIVMVHDMQPYSHPGVPKAVDAYFNDPNCRQKNIEIFPESHGLAVMR